MEQLTLNAQARTGRGKNAARALRREGNIPAVCYGPNQQDPISLAIDPKALMEILSGPYGKNVVFKLNVDEPAVSREVMLKDFYRHPVGRDLRHVDFFAIDHDQTVVVEVPIKLEGRAKGVRTGGRLQQVRRSAVVRCLPANIPEAITYDVSELGIGDRAMASDLVLPEGVELIFHNDFATAQVFLPRGKTVATEES